MSTIAYAMFTNLREKADPGTSTSDQPPAVKSYIDALAALVPAEALSLHALIISQVSEQMPDGSATLKNDTALYYSFWALFIMTVVFYVVPRLKEGFKNLDEWDLVRVLVAPISFVAWTMLQKLTVFDAVIKVHFPTMLDSSRSIIALFLAAAVGSLASWLAIKADQKQPSPQG